MILAVASCSSSSRAATPTTTTTATATTSTTTDPGIITGQGPSGPQGPTGSTAAPTTPRGSTAELRGIYGSALPQGEPDGVSCANVATKGNPVVPLPDVVDFNRTRTVCYLLGPDLVSRADIVGATVVRIHGAPTGLVWAVDVRLERTDFLRSTGELFMGHDIAVVVDGAVRWTPTLGGSHSSAVLFNQFAEVPAQYTRAEAVTIAASIAGIAPSQVSVDARGS
jgi:hypothetical protein